MAVQNSADKEEMASFVREIEAIDAERLSWQMAHVAEGKKFVDDRSDVVKRAKARGISPAALKAVVRQRDFERKAKAEREKLEDDEAHTFDKILESLGQLKGTPLGDKAAEKAGGKKPAAEPSAPAATAKETAAKSDEVTSAVIKAFKKPDPKKADSKLN
jgi:uncharacterized protein (UPF0335 family)